MPQPITNITNGAKVNYPGLNYTWTILAKNHQDFPANSIALMTTLPDLMVYDPPEAPGAPRNMSSTGNALYRGSAIDQWLNAIGLPWWAPSNPFDTSPTYANKPGFLSNFPPEFLGIMLDVERKLYEAAEGFAGYMQYVPYTITRKVFLPTIVDVYGESSTYAAGGGPTFPIFINNASRKTGKAWFTCSSGHGSVLNNNNAPFGHLNYVTSEGRAENDVDGWGIGPNIEARASAQMRPIIALTSDVLVSDFPDTNGVYTLIINQPPTTPGGITVPPGASVGSNIAISWPASTDPEGDPITYELERSVSGGAFAALTTMPGLTYSHAVDGSMGTLQYRVRATDATGASGWAVSAIVPVVNNEAPVISGVDTDLGVQLSPPTVNFTVTDDTPGSGVSLDVYLDGVSILHEDMIELGQQIDITLTQLEFFSLIKGNHTLIATATDGAGESASRIFTFSRVKAPIDYELDPIQAPGRPTSIQVSVRHNAPNLILQACNNALDSEPAWEAIVPGQRLTFANTVSATEQWAIGVKLYAAATSDVPWVYVDYIGGSFMLTMGGGAGGGGGETMMSFVLELKNQNTEQQEQIDELKALLAQGATNLLGGSD